MVSPLLALMRDQLQRLPPEVPGAMLQGRQSRAEVEAVLQDVVQGRIKVCVGRRREKWGRGGDLGEEVGKRRGGGPKRVWQWPAKQQKKEQRGLEALRLLQHNKKNVSNNSGLPVRLQVLYVAPEKLLSGPVMQALQQVSPLPLVCVDEAHCVVEWGDSFRPAYFRCGGVLWSCDRTRHCGDAKKFENGIGACCTALC